MSMVSKDQVEDILRLSPVQEGLLVHRLAAGEADRGLLLLQATLLGELHRERFVQAWAQTLQQHPALRSSVHWQGLPHAVQVVARQVELPLRFEDWSQHQERQQDRLWQQLLDEEQSRGLELGKAPVSRLILVRQGPNSHRLLWLCHHLLLDGWSSALVLGEVLERYRSSSSQGPYNAAQVASFRDYLAWCRDSGATETAPTPGSTAGLDRRAADFWQHSQERAEQWLVREGLVGSDWRGGVAEEAQLEIALDTDHGLSPARLQAWAREQGITVSTLFQAAWALVLSEATEAQRVVFGITVSGRAAPLTGIEGTVGMLANTLPLAISVQSEIAVADWLQGIFRLQHSLQTVEACTLNDFYRAGGVALTRPPFDTLLAQASFPVPWTAARERGAGVAAAESRKDLQLQDFAGDLTTGYPFTLALKPKGDPAAADSGWRVEARYDPERLSASKARALVDRFRTWLQSLVFTDAAAERPSVGELIQQTQRDWPTLLATGRDRNRQGEPSTAPRPLGGTGAEAPVTATQAQLMRIWNDLIAVQEYGLDDNFFDLGGHSLLVPQLLLRVSQDFGVDLGLGTVFAGATVRQLATAIDGQGSKARDAAWSSLVPIRKQGEGAPLFLVHGLGGEVGWFYNLANYLDARRPLYGLQAPAEPFSDLVAMAGCYLEELRRCQPVGPYLLGGYCVGGGVAYEMAQQLRADGERVEALVLIDSVPQAHSREGQARLPTLLASRVRHLVAKGPKQMAASIGDFTQRTAKRAVRRLQAGVAERKPAAVELGDVLDMRTLPQVYHRAAQRHFRAMRDYQPQPYAGDVWLFRTADPRFGEDFGWGRLVQGRLAVERIPGQHVDVLKEPHVRVVGRKLGHALDQAEGGHTASPAVSAAAGAQEERGA